MVVHYWYRPINGLGPQVFETVLPVVFNDPEYSLIGSECQWFVPLPLNEMQVRYA